MIAIAAAGVVAGVIGVLVGMAASRRASPAVRECRDLVQGAVGSHGTVDPRALRDVAIVRYDALQRDVGPAVVLPRAAQRDGRRRGAQLHQRARGDPHLRQAGRGGPGEQELSPEEAQAVQSARLGTGLVHGHPRAAAAGAAGLIAYVEASPQRYGMMGTCAMPTWAPRGRLPRRRSPRWPGTRADVDVQPVPCPSIGATLTAVRTGAADRAVVPIESSVEGIVTATVDDLAGGGDLLIRAETRLPIEFALLAREGTTLADVKTVGGHPQAEAQCRRWLAASLPGREWVPFPSNAEAARRVGEGDLDAALASAAAAARYGLAVLAPDVHDRSNAMTRFVEVGAARLAARADRGRPDLAGRVPRRRPRGRADGDPHRVRRARDQPVHDPVPADRRRAWQLLLLHRLRGAHRRRPRRRGDDGRAPGLRRGPVPRQLPAQRRGADPGPPRHVRRGVRRGGRVAGPAAVRPTATESGPARPGCCRGRPRVLGEQVRQSKVGARRRGAAAGPGPARA